MSRSEYEQFRDAFTKDTEWFKRDELKKFYIYTEWDGVSPRWNQALYKKVFTPKYYDLCDKIATDTAEFNKLIEDDKKRK